MSKWAMVAAAGFLGLSLPLSAREKAGDEQASRLSLDQAAAGGVVDVRSSAGRTGTFSTLNNVWYGPAPLALSDEQRFSFPNAFAWMEGSSADFLPALALAATPRAVAIARPVREAGDKSVGFLPKFDYATSEVGLFYGKSTGKYGREVKAGYILSEIVEGNTHISVGVSYEQSEGRRPLLSR